MDKAKIRLSPTEMELVGNTNWILTKNNVLEKVKIMLGNLYPLYKEKLVSTTGIPEEVLYATPKISRGENYQGLPWMMLDYPRCFKQEDVFAIRTFFWWGHFFSITLHLSGRYLQLYKNNILMQSASLKSGHFFICTSNDPWQHHFGENYYSSIKELSTDKIKNLIETKKFIKLAKKISFTDWDNCTALMEKYFQMLIALTSN